MTKRLKPLITACIVLIALYFMPFVTVSSSDGQYNWRVPFGTWKTAETEDGVTYTGVRSGYALGKDSDNALHAGKEITCYGNTYYYLEDNDVSLTGYSVKSGFPSSSVTYHYQKGNACLGWTNDDEVAWEAGDLKDADLAIDPMKAAEELEWFVIVDGTALNPGIYNDFSRLVKQGVYSILRTLIVENGTARIVDIQLLEEPVIQKVGANEQEAYYRVAVKDSNGITEDWYTRYSETTEVNPRIVSVYEKDAEGSEHQTILFTYGNGA